MESQTEPRSREYIGKILSLDFVFENEEAMEKKKVIEAYA